MATYICLLFESFNPIMHATAVCNAMQFLSVTKRLTGLEMHVRLLTLSNYQHYLTCYADQ